MHSRDEAFSHYLSSEVVSSELLRSNILIGLFTLMAAGSVLLSFVTHPSLEVVRNNSIHIFLLVFFVCIILYELIIRWVIQRVSRGKSRIKLQLLRYGNAFEEASIPTIGIWIIAILLDPREALLGPGSYMYFIFILLGALRLDFRLSLFTGLMSAAQFYILNILLQWLGQGSLLSPFLSVSVISKSLMMVMAGLITGIMTLELKKRIQDTFRAISEHNRLLEEKVRERTNELESLNLELEKKVESGIRKRREQEQLIVQQSKMSAMGEMIGMIAHQWRQPLSNIGTLIGNIRVLFELEQLSEEAFYPLVEDINHQTQYLSTTITDFRSYLSTTKKLETANLTDLVGNALKIIGKSLENKNITVQQDCQFSASIQTYPNELVQVFINILKNAQDAFMENRPETAGIMIRGEESETEQTLHIIDNAGGIPEGILKNIFDPYFTTKGKKDGTGLGLFMSKTIIETHCHGTLDAMNQEGGASFRIVLPLDCRENPETD